HTATLLGGGGAHHGKVLVVGGLSDSNTALTSASALKTAARYDPYPPGNRVGAWTGTTNMSTKRYLQTASQHVPIGNGTTTNADHGQVLVAGGYDGAVNAAETSAALSRISTNDWVATAEMAFGRIRQAATLLASGKVLLVGGDGDYGLGRADADNGTPCGNVN